MRARSSADSALNLAEIVGRQPFHDRAKWRQRLECAMDALERVGADHEAGRHLDPCAQKLTETPSLAPTWARSPSPMSANQCMKGGVVIRAVSRTSAQYRDDAAGTVDADARTIADARGRVAGAHHRGQPVFARTIAAWLIEPPMSDTAALMRWNTGAHVGFVT